MFLADTFFNVIFLILFLFALTVGYISYFIYKNFGIEDLKERKRAERDFRHVYIPKSFLYRKQSVYRCSEELQDYIEGNVLLPEETLIDVLPVLFQGRQVITSNNSCYRWDEGTLLILSDRNIRICPIPIGSRERYRVIGLQHVRNVELESMARKDAWYVRPEPFVHINYTNGNWNRYRCTYGNVAGFIENMNLVLHNQATGMGRRGTIAEELAQLRALREQNIITEEDWQQAKVRFLGRSASKAEESASQIRKLHELYKAGVLSESEFNMKKWDILSKR